MGLFQNISDSLKINGVYSGRKITAASLIICVIMLLGFYCKYSLMFGKFELFIYVLIILLISVAFFLSLIDVKQIIELKNGNVVKTTTTETTETTETKKDATN